MADEHVAGVAAGQQQRQRGQRAAVPVHGRGVAGDDAPGSPRARPRRRRRPPRPPRRRPRPRPAPPARPATSPCCSCRPACTSAARCCSSSRARLSSTAGGAAGLVARVRRTPGRRERQRERRPAATSSERRRDAVVPASGAPRGAREHRTTSADLGHRRPDRGMVSCATGKPPGEQRRSARPGESPAAAGRPGSGRRGIPRTVSTPTYRPARAPLPHPCRCRPVRAGHDRRARHAAGRGHVRRGRPGDHRRLAEGQRDHRDRRGQGARRRGARRVPDPGRPGQRDPAVHQRADRHHRRRWSPPRRGSTRCCRRFLEFARGAVLVAHNAPVRHRLPQGRLRRERHRRGRPAASVDTAVLARRLLTRDEVPNCKLGTLAPFFRATTSAHPPRAGRRPGHRRRAARAVRAARPARRHLARGADRAHPAGRPRAAAQAAPGRRACPHGPGVYLFRGPRDEPLYVGHVHRPAHAGCAATSPPASSAAGSPRWSALAQRVDAIPCAHALEARGPRAAADRRAQAPLQPPVPVPRAGAVGAAHRRAVPPAVGGPPGAPGRRASSSARSPTGGPPTPRSPPCTRRCRCGSAPRRLSRARLRHAPARWPAWAGAARPCTGAQSVDEYAAVAAVFRAAVDCDPRAAGRPAARPGRPAGRRGALRGRRRAARPRRRPACAPSAGGSGWSRWPPSRSWSWPGPTATAAGSCPSSAGAGWSPPGCAPRGTLGARHARRACWPPPRPRPARTASSPRRSTRPSWCCAGWRSRAPGWSSSTGTLACPAPGTGAYSGFLARVETGRAGRDPFADGRSLGTRARPDRVDRGRGRPARRRARLASPA